MRVLVAVAILTMAAFLIYAGLDVSNRTADAGVGGMDAMSVDMDPSSAPANTGTSIGSRQFCARVNENDLLDADEDAEDTLEFDVTVTNIPAGNAAIGTSFELLFPSPNQMTISQVGTPFATDNGWNILNVSDGPQSGGEFDHNVVDLNTTGTSGSGAIGRFNLVTASAVSSGVFPLIPLAAAHIDVQGGAQAPNSIAQGWVAIDAACPAGEPTPAPTLTPASTSSPTPSTTPTPTSTLSGTPGPSATPAPTGSPPPGPEPGDIDCDTDVDAVDALVILRFVAGVLDELAACAQPAAVPSGGAVPGDIDCDDDVDAVDALVILRFVVGLSDKLVAC